MMLRPGDSHQVSPGRRPVEARSTGGRSARARRGIRWGPWAGSQAVGGPARASRSLRGGKRRPTRQLSKDQQAQRAHRAAHCGCPKISKRKRPTGCPTATAETCAGVLDCRAPRGRGVSSLSALLRCCWGRCPQRKDQPALPVVGAAGWRTCLASRSVSQLSRSGPSPRGAGRNSNPAPPPVAR